MKPSLVLALSVALGSLAAFAACSEATEALPATTAEDGGHLPPPLDAAEAEEDGGQADAARDAGARACSDDGFCPTALPPKTTLRGVWGDGAGTAWTVSDEGAILRWTGTTWNLHASGLGRLLAVWGSGPTDVWVGGERGLLHGTGADPASLVFAESPVPGDDTTITSIWGTAAGDVWAVGSRASGDSVEPRVLRYAGPKDAGSSWTLDDVSSRGIAFEHVWGSPATGVWLAGSRPQPPPDDGFPEIAVLRLAPGAAQFAEVQLPHDPLEAETFGKLAYLGGASVAPDGTVHVVGSSVSAVLAAWRGVSADGGTFAFAYERMGASGEPPMRSVAAKAANDVWAAGEYGRLRHWDGSAWTQAAVTVTRFPVTKTFHGVWAKGGELWAVGDGIALHRAETTNP